MEKSREKISLKSITDSYKNNINVLSIIICILFGIFNTLGRAMYYEHNLPDDTAGWMRLGLIMVLSAVLAWVLIPVIDIAARWLILTGKTHADRKFILYFGISFAVITLCWLPWIISFCPCSAEYDTYAPLMGYMGYTGWNTATPRFYTCLTGYFYKLGLIRNNKELGWFAFIIIRDLFNITIFSYIAAVLCTKVNRITGFLTMIFYAVTPVWGAYAKHVFKDTSYLALFAWYMCECVLLAGEIRNRKVTAWRCILYAFSGLSACLFRSNGYYVVLPVTICLCLVLLLYSKDLYRMILTMLGVAAFLGYQNYSLSMYNDGGDNSAAFFLIPFQQVARTVMENGDSLTDEEIEIIDRVQKYETLADRYNMLLTDPVARSFPESDTRMKYIKTWVSMFFKYPQVYVEAFVGQNYGYYAFTPRETEFNAGNGNSGMTIWHWVKDDRFPGEVTCNYYFGDMAQARADLQKWADLWDTIPVINMTNSMPMYTWLIVLAVYYLIRKKRWIYCIPMIAMMLMILTCIVSPVNGSFRYYCGIAAAFPTIPLLLKEGRGDNV